MNNIHKIQLHGVSEYAKNILKHYDNKMLLIEYDHYGAPLNKAPNGKFAIFCMSPDGFWRGWFVLDDDVRFRHENDILNDIIK